MTHEFEFITSSLCLSLYLFDMASLSQRLFLYLFTAAPNSTQTQSQTADRGISSTLDSIQETSDVVRHETLPEVQNVLYVARVTLYILAVLFAIMALRALTCGCGSSEPSGKKTQ